MGYYKKDKDLLKTENFQRICNSLIGKYRVVNGKVERIKGFNFIDVDESFWSTATVPILSEVAVQEYNINNELLDYTYRRSKRTFGFKPFIEKIQLDVKKFDEMMRHHAQFEENTVKRLKA